MPKTVAAEGAAPPLVSIGIPTYNRCEELGRAVLSALGQTYLNIEIVVSDNASTDGTEQVCRQLAQMHPSVRYLRHPKNEGAVSNFLRALAASRGEYFMWLGDDDWIDANYVAACQEYLASHPAYVLACGRDHYIKGGAFWFAGPKVSLHHDSRCLRVLSYFWKVQQNGMFYGLMRRSVLAPLRFPDDLAGDWFLMAQVAVAGKTETLDSVVVYREVGGSSNDLGGLARGLGYTEAQARNPWWQVVKLTFSELRQRTHAVAEFPRCPGLAACCAAAVALRMWLPDRIAPLRRMYSRHIGWRFRRRTSSRQRATGNG